MTRIVALAAMMAAAFALTAPPVEAKKSHYKHYNDNRSNRQAWDGRGNPWARPNCFAWSRKIQYWVWVCGKPYPVEMPNREDPRLRQ
ncbi:hypothetical protein [Bauldia sp.]|uniref:hypothetical protein n=1 Tax=Bauldia sp. TaxID=2575872 RepID=UPI003BAC37B1